MSKSLPIPYIAGEDYIEVTPQIMQFPTSFERAEGRWCVTLQIIDDQDYEGELPESFVISLSISDAAVIMNQASATVSILDDEGVTQLLSSRCLLCMPFHASLLDSCPAVDIHHSWLLPSFHCWRETWK